MPLWAVHISDGVLTAPFWLGGFLLAALLLFWGSRRVQDEEIPRIALLTAAFFVASTIHLKAPPTSVHLLLNGLTGVLLGRRAALAIAGGLVLQAILIGHGGFYSLGANICVMTCPALLAGLAFPFLRRQLRAHRGVICSALVFVSCSLLFVTTVFSLAMVGYLIQVRGDWREHLEAAWNFTAQPWLLAAAFAFALPAAWLERRIQATPLFALGFFLGSLTVLATSGLNCLVLLAGGEKVWPVAPWALVVLHLPVAVLEGLIMGVTLKFLSRVKPELLDTPAYAQLPTAAPQPALAHTMPETPKELPMSTNLEDAVRSRYAATARSGLSTDQPGVRAVAEAFGYSADELLSIPAEANMGLSCGNPTAFASLKPGEVVVDLGCGGGLDVFLAASKVGPTGKAIGIDMTTDMLDLARANARKAGLANVDFHLAHIDRLPLPDASVDCVVSNCVINLAPDKPAVFREIARILKPGGRLAVSDIALKQPLPPELAQDIMAYVGCIAGAVPIDAYRTHLLQAGFASVQVQDTGADLNAYAKVENQAACCSPTPTSSTLPLAADGPGGPAAPPRLPLLHPRPRRRHPPPAPPRPPHPLQRQRLRRQRPRLRPQTRRRLTTATTGPTTTTPGLS